MSIRTVPHPSGVPVRFDCRWHQYTAGRPPTALRPVSRLLDRHFPFDEPRVVAAVARKSGIPPAEVRAAWGRQALLGKNIHEYIENTLQGLPPPTWTLLVKRQQQRMEREGGRKRESEKKKKKGSKAEETDDAEGKKAVGTEESIEKAMLHGEEAAYMVVADRVVDTITKNYDIIAVEQVIASPSWGIAGTVDFIARNKRTHKLLIGDWKTSGSVVSAFRFGSFETPCTGCLLHLPNSKFYRYAMQVIIYGEILKREKYFTNGFFGQQVKPISKALSEINVNPRDIHEALEYGIVQLSKNEEGEVCAEFKRVTESTVLPVDAEDLTFRELLKNVMTA
ncbi:hypothetical protein LSM04_002144 [Trypanosoma melophagium]|uniref:uncharacterized protein n=1 Tax=Trypanosoma melophagium TaxID=715481 RepID=UPI00351A78EA|nr:hypothetical protein LSM04_002144 [Trypanosoma melophagium]